MSWLLAMDSTTTTTTTANGDDAGASATAATAVSPTTARSNEGSQRVCDRCISKKVKCDLQRPRCSRCQETDSECIYSAVKRRPGPRKGWTRVSKRTLSTSSSVTKRPRDGPKPIQSAADSTDSAHEQTTNSTDTPWPTATVTSYSDASTIELPVFRISNEQARALIDIYFAQDHHMIPLFNRSIFFQQYDLSLIPTVLVHALAAVTAVIYAENLPDRPSDARAFLDSLLRSVAITELEISLDISLHEYQLLCLLAHYDFHQRPGPRSWVRIGNLARKAYRLGLHQLENPPHCALFDTGFKSTDKEDWRRLWWTIYCLDSYANITAGTPLIVEQASVRTALPMFHDYQTTGIRCNPAEPVFLPSDTADLWKTMQRLTSCGSPHEFDMHVAMACLINEAANCLRLVRQNPCERLILRIKSFEDHLAAARIALPATYLDPVRRIWTNETGQQHHARLYNIVLMHSATIMIVLARLISAPQGEDAINWQRVLECCEDIVNAVKYWDSTKLTTADPAICFTFSGVLTLLFVCSKCSPVSTVSPAAAELQATFDRQMRILKLYLEHFGMHWFLPRFLLASHDKLTEIFSQPMEIHEAKRVIQGHQTLLQQRWLSTMARVEQTDDFQEQQQVEADAAAYFDDWPMNEWIAELMGNPVVETSIA